MLCAIDVTVECAIPLIAAIIADIWRLLYPDALSPYIESAMLPAIPFYAGDTPSVAKLITAHMPFVVAF